MASTSSHNARSPLLLRRVAVPLVTLAGGALALLAFFAARESQERHATLEFRRRAEVQYSMIHMRIQRNFDTLYALRTLFSYSTNVSPDEFRSWAYEITNHCPQIIAVEWLPLVMDTERAQFEREMAALHPGFEIRDRPDPYRAVRAEQRPAYFPATFVEPLGQNPLVVGVDAATGRAAGGITNAARNGDLALSPPVALLRRTNQLGLVLSAAVYKHEPIDTPEQRQAAVRGIVRAVFSPTDLFGSAWEQVGSLGVNAQIFDASAGLIYSSPSSPAVAVAHEVKTQIAGRDWIFRFSPQAAWWRTEFTLYPFSLLAAGACLTVLLSVLVHSLLRRTEVIEREVADRTERLSTANESLAKEVEERQRTEDRLRKSERRLIDAQRIGRIGNWEIDLVTKRLSWSDEVYRIFGREPGDFEPTSEAFYNAVHPEDRAIVRSAIETALRGGTSYDIEHRIVLPNQSQRFVLEHAEPNRDAQGKIVALIGTVQDISERKQDEERLVVEHNLLETIIESLPDLVFVKDARGRFLRINSANQRVLGLNDVSQAVGKTDADVLPPELAAVYMADDEQVIKNGQPILNREEPIVTRDGERRWLLTSKAPFRDGSGRVAGIVGIARDITERRRAEDERAHLDRKFRETQKLESLGVLAGGIAHDFNNLLTGILGNASLARMDLPEQSPLHPYLQEIEHSSHRAADLCKQMLAYSGKGRFVIQAVDISALVQETLHLLQLSISKKASLNLELPSGLPAVMADATQLRQVLMNLVINASEAIGDQPGVIGIRTGRMNADKAYLIELSGGDGLPEGEYVYLEITDNGCGMTPEVKARIFEPFFTTKFTGRGLGLAATLGIVRGHKGALKAYSEDGRGSTFKLLLPATATPAAENRPERSTAPSKGSGSILVVDDEEPVRIVTARMLSALGFEPVVANDGAQALEIYERANGSISGVLLDLTMPKLDGAETFREIRLRNPNAFVILMSGFNEQEAVARFVGKGLAGFIQKPFTPDQLRAKLQPLVGRNMSKE